MTTAFWSPNQVSVAQVETYTFTVPSSVGNTYTATINGKSITYTSVAGDTAASVATALFNLLTATSTSLIAPELTEITFTNPSDAVIVATAVTPGTPFANVTINGVSGQGLVMSTGNGLSNGISTAHTTANRSPSDVNDAQNWLRITGAAPGVRQLPQNSDDMVVANTSVPMLWNLDALSTVTLTSYTRWQSFTGTIGLPENNTNGYAEWRATYFKIAGPTGSAPSGGLPMVLGYSSGSGIGPSRERYNMGSSRFTLTAIAAGNPSDEYGVRVLGVHTDNVINVLNGVTVGVAMLPGEISTLNAVTCSNGSTIAIGPNVTWATNIFGTASSCAVNGASIIINAVPATLTLSNSSPCVINTSDLTWTSIAAQGGSSISFLAGGTITTLTLATSSTFDKSQDSRALTITNSTIDGDTCQVNDPLNAITWTNATSVRERVSSGPFIFTGTKTVKVT